MSKLSARVLASYSGVTIPMAAMGMPIAVYLPPFYSDGLGLSLVTVGTVFTLARIWDVVTDPVMGLVIDRFDSRWGRRKHWIALSIPILLVSVWAVFMPDPDAVSGGYLLFWMIALYVGYTMLAIAHQSWGAELTSSYDDRSRLFGWREIFVIGGMTAVLAIPALIELSGQEDQGAKVASMGWFCLILFPLTVLPTLMFVPDTHQPPATSVRWREALGLLVRNAILWRLLAADLTPMTARKRWIASMKPKGDIMVDDGAARALATGKSLLPAGVSLVSGAFGRGDPVAILDSKGHKLGQGLARYDAAEAGKIKGHRSEDIEALLGYPGRAALIHRDDMAL